MSDDIIKRIDNLKGSIEQIEKEIIDLEQKISENHGEIQKKEAEKKELVEKLKNMAE